MNATSLDVQLRDLLALDVPSAIRYEQTRFDELAGESNRPVVIFGAGNLGRKTLAGLRTVGIEPAAFVDNNSALWNQTLDRVIVLPPEVAASRYGSKAVVVITVWSAGVERRFGSIKEQLVNLGFSTVVSFVPLFWKHPDLFLPHARLDLPHRIYERRDEVFKAFSLLSDHVSREEYVAQVKLLLSEDFYGLPHSSAGNQYFPEDLFSIRSDEIFIDCGAFDGDTIRDLVAGFGEKFGQVIALEPDPSSFRLLSEYVSMLATDLREKVTIRQSAVGDRAGTVRFELAGPGSSVKPGGMLEVTCVALDEVLDSTQVTYIKMDIEGSEPEALVGARNLIQRLNPILGICVYHLQDHLWSIPLLIHSLAPRHQLFLRRHGQDEFGDVVCYAVPKDRLMG